MDSDNGHLTNYSPHRTTNSFVPIIAGLNSGERLAHYPNEQRAEGVGHLHQQVTISTLPGDVLFKVFKFLVDATYVGLFVSEKWRTLVHVCRRWRNMVFASPRHLNLRLLCGPYKRSVKKVLNIWPELPIYIDGFIYPAKVIRDNVADALRLNHRVSGIRLIKFLDSAWETFAPLMQHPFPLLTYLWLELYQEDAIPRSFLGGSSPSLRDLYLEGAPFPALPELILSATNLVHLSYHSIPRSGYISPQAMVAGLVALTRLESLSLTFRSRQSLPDKTIRIPPPHTRTLLPVLIYFEYEGNHEYMEDLAAQIDTPLLQSMEIALFHQEVLEVSELANFIRRADKLSLPNQAKVVYRSDYLSLSLSSKSLVIVDHKTILLDLHCRKPALRLSYLAQFCASCLPTLSPYECLHIHVSITDMWNDVTEDSDGQWPKLLRPFNTVKELLLCKTVAPHVAQALRTLQVEQVTQVLPALETFFMLGRKPSGPVMEAISEYADARQLSGHPVYLRFKG